MSWNSTFKTPAQPMKRAPLRNRVSANTFSLKLSKRMKASQPKMTPIRKSAKGEECTIRLPGICNYDASTTVLCHSNALKDGKGLGLKAPDTCAAYGCSACHDVVDRRVPIPAWLKWDEIERLFQYAILRTQEILMSKGLVK